MDENNKELVEALDTLLTRWQSDIETLEEWGYDEKSVQLKKCHAEIKHFVDKHRGCENE